MSVLATMQMLPDPMASAPKRAASDTDSVAPGDVSWGDAFMANWRLNQDDSMEYVLSHKIDAYNDVADALKRKGYPAARYVAQQRPGGTEQAWSAIWADVEAERRKQPGSFSDIPTTRDEFEQWAAARKGERARDAVVARQGGIGSQFLPGLAWGLLNGFQPENLPTMFMGGGAKNAGEFLLKQAVAGAQMTAIQTPERARARAAMGEGYTPGELGTDLAMGGVVNAAFAGGLTYGPPLLAKALKIPRAERTPSVQAAINVVERAQDIEATSPFTGTHAGHDAHLENLADAMAQLEAGQVDIAAPVPKVHAPAGTVRPVLPETAGAVDAYIAAVKQQESGGRANAQNPQAGQTASGLYGFTNGTWVGTYKSEFPNSGLSDAAILARKGDVALQERLMRRLTQDNAARLRNLGEDVTPGNLYVMHHLGGGDAPKVFRADPGARLDTILSRDVIDANPHLANMTAGEFTAWAARKMGGEAGGPGLAGLGGGEAPVLRPAALDAVRPSVTAGGIELPLAQFTPDQIGVDAGLMQFKSGGDANGVTERLHGVQQWDPMAAGIVTVWEANDGRRLIADGHQRLGLAQRMQAADPSQQITLNAFVLREADGFTATDARVLTALKNIGEGTGTATDAAKVFRDVGMDFEQQVARKLPPRSALVRDGKSLARLSDEAFGAVVNEVIPESHGAAIGALAPDPETHAGLVELLHKLDPPNRKQAEAIVRQALDAGFAKEHQEELFGSRNLVTALFAQKARALDKVLGELRRMKGAFSVAARNAEALDAAGNHIDVNASTAAAEGNARALALVESLALRKGNAVSEIFNVAAERLAKGESPGSVVRDVVRQLGELDLTALDREAGPVDRPFGAAGERGRGTVADDEAGALSDAEALTPATRDELEAAGQGGFALFDEPAAQAFDEPAGEGIQQVADSAWHDAVAEVLFHGSRAEQITQFDIAKAGQTDIGHYGKGIYFTPDQNDALRYKPENGGSMITAKVALRKPFHWDQSSGAAEARTIAELKKILGADLDRFLMGSSIRRTPEAVDGVTKALRAAGYDGVEARTPSGSREVVAFDAEQITILSQEGAKVDPNIAAKARQEADLAAQQPLRGDRKTGAAQDPTMPDGLFGGPQEPTFDLGDGKGERPLSVIQRELDAEEAGVEAIRACLIPPNMGGGA